MSACIYRHAGKPRICGQDKRPCRWWRAAWCISTDVIGAACQAFLKMILGGGCD
ncbi:MAG: hypothetical protein AABZ15_11665 [Nitrospirota bacterium]